MIHSIILKTNIPENENNEIFPIRNRIELPTLSNAMEIIRIQEK